MDGKRLQSLTSNVRRNCTDCTDDAEFEEEIDRLREMLHSTDKAGGYYIRPTGEEKQEGSGIS